MKKFLFVMMLLPAALCAQWEVSYHQSNLPFAGVGYTFQERFNPELRLNTDVDIEDIAVEGVFKYKIILRDSYAFYAGLGLRSTFFEGLVVPVGLEVYPFASRQFGIHMEMAPLLGSADGDVLRGSWGIRYRFGTP